MLYNWRHPSKYTQVFEVTVKQDQDSFLQKQILLAC